MSTVLQVCIAEEDGSSMLCPAPDVTSDVGNQTQDVETRMRFKMDNVLELYNIADTLPNLTTLRYVPDPYLVEFSENKSINIAYGEELIRIEVKYTSS